MLSGCGLRVIRHPLLLEESKSACWSVGPEAVTALALDPGEARSALLLLLSRHAVDEEPQRVAIEQRVVPRGEEEDRHSAQALHHRLGEPDDAAVPVPERRGRAGEGGDAGHQVRAA